MAEEWIKVTEKLPEPFQEVLIYTGYGHVQQVMFHDLLWIDEFSEFYEPEYWMPLPAPPKEETTGEKEGNDD